MRLEENILRFEEHYAKALELRDLELSDYFAFTALAMECFQATNALIEIAEHIVVGKRLGTPSSYREIFDLLQKHGLLTAGEHDAARKLVYLRNLIAHEYHKISAEELRKAVELLGIMRGFIARIKESVRRKI